MTIRFFLLRIVMVALSLVKILSILHQDWFSGLSLGLAATNTTFHSVAMYEHYIGNQIRFLPIARDVNVRMKIY